MSFRWNIIVGKCLANIANGLWQKLFGKALLFVSLLKVVLNRKLGDSYTLYLPNSVRGVKLKSLLKKSCLQYEYFLLQQQEPSICFFDAGDTTGLVQKAVTADARSDGKGTWSTNQPQELPWNSSVHKWTTQILLHIPCKTSR